MEKLNLNKKALLTTLILAYALFSLIPLASASVTIASGISVNIGSGRWITMGKDITFPTPVTYGNGLFDGRGFWINSTQSLTLRCWFENNWINYTSTGLGAQYIYNNSKPTLVILSGENRSEGSGWSYSETTHIIFIMSFDTVEVYFGEVGTPPPAPTLGNLKVKGSYDGLYIAGFTCYWHNTTDDSANQTALTIDGYTFTNLTVGDYTIYGFYGNLTANTSATTVAGSTVTAYLNFGGSAPPTGFPDLPFDVATGRYPIVYGTNISMYYPVGSRLGFQADATIEVLVTVGTWDTYRTNITVYRDWGVIWFLPATDVNLTVNTVGANNITLYASGEGSTITKLSSSEWHVSYSYPYSSSLSWSVQPISYIDMYTMLVIGMLGIGLIVFVPAWIAWHVKDKGVDDETWKRLILGMAFFFIGLGLFLVWVWP